MEAIQRMRILLPNLPKRDQQLAETFIENRLFAFLKELVDSAFYKTKKNIKSENPTQEYLDVDICELSKLKAEVDVYNAQFDLINNTEEDEFEEEFI